MPFLVLRTLSLDQRLVEIEEGAADLGQALLIDHEGHQVVACKSDAL
jgi:hypothetical protein